MKVQNKIFKISLTILSLFSLISYQVVFAEEATVDETPIETTVPAEPNTTESTGFETSTESANQITETLTTETESAESMESPENEPGTEETEGVEAPAETQSSDTIDTENSTNITSTESLLISDTVNLTIRLNDSVIYSASTTISSSTVPVTDNTGTTTNIAQNTVLGMFTAADTASEAFTITDLAYFSSFDSYIINCISVSDEPSCYNWQYTVNDVYPFVAIEDYNLTNGDDVYFYFGTQNRFSVATTSVSLGEPIVVIAEKYQYRTNDWIARNNVMVGATQPNSADIWTPIVVTSTLTNDLGQASLYLTTTGTYNIGIGEDYYYPTETVTVTDAISTSTSTSTTNSETGTGSGSNIPVTESVSFEISTAATFLLNQQESNGGIGSASFYSDWAAMAIGSLGNSSAKSGLITYLKTDPSPGTTATDYERRAMALLALGINPYTGTPTDYIALIMQKYDGNQFGDAGLVNDDIFALFPLLKSGYSTTDPEIQKAVTFILSKQNGNGGWESPDLTAAAVQALAQVKSLDGVNDSLGRAKNYLKLSTKTDGRIGDNAFSTSWGLQALSALEESAVAWNGSNTSPLHYLATQQQNDGGVNISTDTSDNRIWATSYAIPGVQGRTWDSILMAVPKFTADNSTSNNSTNTNATSTTTTTETPTTTPQTVTLTPEITTSTIQFTTTTEGITPTRITTTQTTITEPLPLPVFSTPISESIEETAPSPPTIRAVQIANINNNPEQIKPENLQPTTTAEQLTAPTPINTEDAQKKALFGGAAALAGSAGAYLAWRFIQGLV